MELVLKDKHGYSIFVAEVYELSEYHVKFTVYRITAWDQDKNFCKDDPEGCQQYLDAYIKWDGCSHVTFGDLEGGMPDGYLHICGVDSWKNHVKLIEWLYKEASRLIEHFDRSELWE